MCHYKVLLKPSSTFYLAAVIKWLRPPSPSKAYGLKPEEFQADQVSELKSTQLSFFKELIDAE